MSASHKPKASPAPASAASDALAKLTADHALVKKLFDQYEKTKDKLSNEEKNALAAAICGELTVHATIEEEIFYPALREIQDDELKEMLDEAEVEHGGARSLIAQLSEAKPDAPLYDAKVTVLGENIKHHAGEEENEMFAKVRKLKQVNLQVLGEQLTGRADELKSEMGMK